MRATVAAGAALFLLLPVVASAGAVNKVFSPIVEWGEMEVELRGFFTRDSDPAKNALRVDKLDFAWGVTQWWFTELEFVFERPPGGDEELEAIALENVFQLTEQGQYFADFGLFVEYERELEERVHEIIVGPIVQKQVGQWISTTNIFFEKKFGPDNTESEIETKTSQQFRYRLSQAFEPGLEYYGSEGDENVGPAAFGMVRFAESKFKWQAAWLFGLTEKSADNSIRWMLEYEW